MIATEDKVEWRLVKEVFGQYKQNELYLKEAELPKVTDNYQLSMTFDGAAIHLVPEYELKIKEAKRYNAEVVSAVNRLSEIERKIIIPSYMQNEYTPPWVIFESLHIGRTLFYTLKSKAIGKLYVLFQTAGLKKSAD